MSQPSGDMEQAQQGRANRGSVTSQMIHGTMLRHFISEDSLIYHELTMSQASGLNQCDVQVIITETGESDVDKLEYQKPAYVAVGLIMAMTLISVFFPMIITGFGMEANVYQLPPPDPCKDQCRFSLVESIPENLNFTEGSPSFPSTYETWASLIDSAQESIDIASFYWTLRGSDVYKDPSDWQGESIFNKLSQAVENRNRKVKLRIAVDAPGPDKSAADIDDLARKGADVRRLNFTEFFGSGVLHTKLWIVDRKHFYVGSANMDWRSLTQVKELGAVVHNCSCLVTDVQKLFDVYWYMGAPGAQVPDHWPSKYNTHYNMDTPLHLGLNNTASRAFMSSSPPPFCPSGRTSDIDAILDVINSAESYVHIAVMDYFPTTLYTNPKKFWPVIDDALRKVALERKVEVRVLASWWNHSYPSMRNYLQSLADLNGAMGANIQVKLFTVPVTTPAEAKIPFGRVNHNKYMVTDNTAYIGTSNWSGDYFISTGGVALIVNQTEALTSNSTLTSTSVQQQLASVFDRDWNSTYAKPIQVISRHSRKRWKINPRKNKNS